MNNKDLNVTEENSTSPKDEKAEVAFFLASALNPGTPWRD